MGWWPCGGCGGGSPTCPPCDCSSWQLAISGVADAHGSDYSSFINGTHIFSHSSFITGCGSSGYSCLDQSFGEVTTAVFWDTSGPTCTTRAASGITNDVAIKLKFQESGGSITITVTIEIYGFTGTTPFPSTAFETYTWAATGFTPACSISNSSWLYTAPPSTICSTAALNLGSLSMTCTTT